jgi:hypothetical protein
MSPSAFGQSDNVSNPTKAADQDIREQLDCKFDGDLWIQSAKLPDGSDMMETWQRMKPDEDVSLRPSDIEP